MFEPKYLQQAIDKPKFDNHPEFLVSGLNTSAIGNHTVPKNLPQSSLSPEKNYRVYPLKQSQASGLQDVGMLTASGKSVIANNPPAHYPHD